MSERFEDYPPFTTEFPGKMSEHQRRLAYAIRAVVALRGVSCTDLEREMRFLPNTITSWLQRKAVPNPMHAFSLGRILGVNPILFVKPPEVPHYSLEGYLLSSKPSETSRE